MSFEFTHEGTVYHVRTEVGEGPARVVVDEQNRPEPDLEPQEDERG